MSDIVKSRLKGESDSFSFIRFAEWRPQALSAEITLEIPTLAQYLKDDDFSPVTFHLWLEVSALSLKNVDLICKRVEELIDISFSSTKNSFRVFPPTKDSFELVVHLLSYDIPQRKIQIKDEFWSNKELTSTINRGFSWELQKRISNAYKELNSSESWDNSQWNLENSLSTIFSSILNDDDSTVVNYHGILLSGWHTTGPFEEVLDFGKNFDLLYFSKKLSFFTIAPINKYVNDLGKALNLKIECFTSKNYNSILNSWKRKLLSNIEPLLDLTIKPHETWGNDFSSSTNAALFQDVITEEKTITFYNLQSIRYPLRINWSFTLPTEALEQQLDSFNPVVWNNLNLTIKTASGRVIKVENISDAMTYRLPQGNLEYQPERELNERMRLADSLKYRLERLLDVQSSKSEIIRKLIAEPQLLEDNLDHELIAESLNDIKLAFEILDYLAEEELLLAEIPPITKMFKPPETDLLSGL